MADMMRNSSIELFRIIATFLVLIVHFNGWFLGGIPEKIEIYTFPNLMQVFIVSISCICVNCFLVISGWFSVKMKIKAILNIVSIVLVAYLLNALLGIVFYNYPFKSLISAFFVFSKESYYFQCYLMLILLSPVLNAFIDKYQKQILPLVLSILGVEVYIHWFRGNECLGFMEGYGLTHFVAMYFYARCAYLYKDKLFSYNLFTYLAAFVLSVLAIYAIYFLNGATRAFSYANPFNIIATFSLFLIFAKMEFSNKFINWFSVSTFMVYMIHVNNPSFDFLSGLDKYLYIQYSYGKWLLCQASILIIYFFVAILIDKMRIITISPIINCLSTNLLKIIHRIDYCE